MLYSQKLIVLILTLLSLLMSSKVNAVACFDFANLQQNIAGYLQEQTNFLTQMKIYRSQMKLNTLIASKKQKNDDKNTAGIIKAMSEVEVQVANRLIATKYDPLDNACDVAEENKDTSQTEEAVGKKINQTSSQQIKDGTKPRSSYQQQLKNQLLIEKLAINSDLLMSSSRFLGIGGTFTDKEIDQSQDFIDYITRSYRDEAPPNKVSKESSSLSKVQRVEAVTKQLRKQIVRDAFNAIRISNLPLVRDANDQGISRMQAIDNFIKARFGSEDAINFIALATNTHPDKASDSNFNTSETEVIRMIAVMDAFSLYLNGLQYQENIRQTQLSALMVQIMLEQADAR